MGWIQEVAGQTIQAVAEDIGMTKGRMRSWAPCPACGRDQRGSSDRRGPVGVTPNGHGWKCFRCSESGDVADLIGYAACGKRIRELSSSEKDVTRGFAERLCSTKQSASMKMDSVGGMIKKRAAARAVEVPTKTESPPVYGGPFAWSEDLFDRCRSDLDSEEGRAVLDYLMGSRNIGREAIDDWGLGALLIRRGDRVVEKWVAIPLRDGTGRVVNIRFRSVPSDCLYCEGKGCDRCKQTGDVKKGYRVCAGRPLTLFGAHRLGADTSEPVLITEGELDVIALHQYGWDRNLVSGTAGASANWQESWLDAIEPYSSFVLLYDDDSAGEAGAKKLAEKLGEYRCSRAILPRNDAGECLIDGVPVEEVERAIGLSKPMLQISLRMVDEYAQDLESLINNPETLIGRETGSMKLDKILGGMRSGLWVMTGETGSGKTTFATWLAWEQARLGVGALLTSFEQRPIGTVQKLLRSQLGGDFMQSTAEERRVALDELGKMPLWILDHYGESTAEDVIGAVRYARRRHGCKVALIDHLGFLTRGSGDKERQRIEEVVRELALIAVNDGITIILIVHPNRTWSTQGRRVKISDLKGASAIEQDAHVGVVVERQPARSSRGFPSTMVHVDKVRSEFGEAGSRILMAFDPLACVFADTWEATPSGARGMRPDVSAED